MAATDLNLELSDAQAKKIVKLAIENGAYSDDMPEDKKGRAAAALEAVEFCIDSWVNDGIRPDDDDKDFAAAGAAIVQIFEAAGIEIDDDGNIVTPEADDDDDDDDEPSAAADDDEEAFNPDDYIEGWSELSSASKIKALKELDLDDEDTLGIVQSLQEWETENEPKGFAKVLSWIEENTEGSSDDDDDDDNGDDDDGEPEAEAMEEPWEGYDKATAVDIKKVLDETMESDDGLDIEQVEYVKEYEESKEKPRKRVLDKCDELIEALSDSDNDDDSDDDDDEPVKRRGSGTGKNVGALGKAKAAKASNGSITLTREQILEALTDGSVEIDL